MLLFLCAPSGVWACDCAYSGAPCKAFASTPYVFSGKVTKVSTISVKMSGGDEYQNRLATFEVARVYRGLDVKKSTEVVTGFGGGDCGYDFRAGESYLVYAFPHVSTGKLYTGICSRTRPLSEAKDDLEYLAEKDDPAHGAGIEGWIDELARGPDNNTEVTGGLRDVRVKIAGPSGRWTVITDGAGRFRLWGLSPGIYRVTPEYSVKFIPEAGRSVTLKEKSCEELRFLATPPRHKTAH
jgi:hypothetical protein